MCNDACYMYGMIRQPNCSGEPFRASLGPTFEELNARRRSAEQAAASAAAAAAATAEVEAETRARSATSSATLLEPQFSVLGGMLKAATLGGVAYMSGAWRRLAGWCGRRWGGGGGRRRGRVQMASKISLGRRHR